MLTKFFYSWLSFKLYCIVFVTVGNKYLMLLSFHIECKNRSVFWISKQMKLLPHGRANCPISLGLLINFYYRIFFAIFVIISGKISQMKNLKGTPLLLLAPGTIWQPRCQSCTGVQGWWASFALLLPACILPKDNVNSHFTCTSKKL